MNKLNQLIMIASILMFTFSGCEDKDKWKYDISSYEKYFLPQVVLTEDSPQSINPEDVNNAVLRFRLNVTMDEGAPLDFNPDIERIELMAVYNGISDSVSLFSSTTYPVEVTIEISDLEQAFDPVYFRQDADSLTAGDNFYFFMRITKNDGEVINGLNDQISRVVYDEDGNLLDTITYYRYHTDFRINESGNDNANKTIYVNCPESLTGRLAGTYTVISNGTNTDGQPPAVDVEAEVTLTNKGGGVYGLDNIFADVYEAFYCDAYDYCFENTGDIVEVCGSVIGTWTDSFGANVYVDGNFNESTGVITIHWVNDFGDEATSVYTPAK